MALLVQKIGKVILLLAIMLGCADRVQGQCDPIFPTPLSPRIGNYVIDLRLDADAKTVRATQQLRWRNTSPDTLRELRFYMYLNAFKNSRSTFLSGTNQVFGQPFVDRNPNEWGWIRVDTIRSQSGAFLHTNAQYLQPNDGNPDDQTVLAVPLDVPLLPGAEIVLDMAFSLKMPKTIARSGYSKDDFFLFVHWFPQAGVYEAAPDGKSWRWNCHQFFRQTEFFADFGNYDVRITTPKHLVVGASGCLMEERENSDGTTTRRYVVQDVIDFAWSVFPFFQVTEKKWKHVSLRFLTPPEHAGLLPRYVDPVVFSLEYMEKHIGKYPYKSLTVVDPPFHGMRSGMMEYPTLITVAGFAHFPEGIRNFQSLAAHEFLHQYFMMMVASNEKEEAWLDEGFVTYYEDRIIDEMYGAKRAYLDFPFFGLHWDSREQTRLEYTGLKNHRIGPPARPGWEIEGNYKAMVYSKPATTLHTLHALIGQEAMDKLMQTYFERWKYKHPRGADFMAVLYEVVAAEKGVEMANTARHLFQESIYGRAVCDYAVGAIEHESIPPRVGWFDDATQSKAIFSDAAQQDVPNFRAKVSLQRLGDFVLPVDVLVRFADGTDTLAHWDGREAMVTLEFLSQKKVVSAHIDPQQRILLDINLNNNSLTAEKRSLPAWKYAAKASFWLQNFLMSLGALV